jgi:3-oxoadipate enol-lactonase
MPLLRVNEGELYYIEQGSGAVSVVFGHGTLISSAIWRDFYFKQLPPNWHALAIDFRGHGGSYTVRGCTFVQMAEDIVALARARNLGRFVYIGLSMGGGVGLQLALSRPELLRGLILLSPVTGLGSLGNLGFRLFGHLAAGRRWLLRAGLRAASTRPPSREELDRVVEEAVVVSQETLKEYLGRKNVIEGTDRLASLNVPTLVLIGAKDSVIPVAQQERLAATIPGCRKVVFPNDGHALTAEKPTEVLAELRRFIDDLP